MSAATELAVAAIPPAPPVAAAAPPGLRLTRDPGARFVAGGLVLVGGSPVRVLRLTAAGARQVKGWFSGTPLPSGEASRVLARRLLDAGLAHPDVNPHPSSRTVAADSSAATVPPGGPAVTVVIPVRDRHAELARCLTALRAVPERTTADGASRPRPSPAPPLEPSPADGAAGLRPVPAAPPTSATSTQAQMLTVIVVDDASADPGAIAAIAAAHGAQVIHRPVNGGPGAARNTGLAAASTELVAFLDSDCVPGPGWLDRLLPHFADPAVGAVAPRIVPHQAGASWLARYEGASSTLDMGARPSIVRPGARVPYVPGAALVVRRSAAGAGFAERMYVGEDVDFIWRMAAAGWRVRYEPSATMGHDHRVRFRAWFSRRADYGTSAAALEQLHPGAVRPLYASWWTIAAWAAALAGRPALATGLTATATTLLARRLSAITAKPRPLPTTPRPPVPAPAPPTTPTPAPASTAGPASAVVGRPGVTAWRLAVQLAGGGTLAAGRPIGSALSRTWWPVVIPAAIAFPRLRRPVAALIVIPPLLDWADRRPPLDPVRYVGARLLDDVAYSLGVWQGCIRRRTIAPLLPVIGASRQPRPHE